MSFLFDSAWEDGDFAEAWLLHFFLLILLKLWLFIFQLGEDN